MFSSASDIQKRKGSAGADLGECTTDALDAVACEAGAAAPSPAVSESGAEAVADADAHTELEVPTLCITNVQRYSLHDGGGIRSVVFTKGCPFTCPWCCNPENLSFSPEVSWKRSLCIGCSVREDGVREANGAPCSVAPELCPTKAKERLGEVRTPASLADELLRDLVFFEESGGGVTVSGGECMAGKGRQRAVLELLGLVHEKGVHTALETTLATKLFVEPAELVAACDLFLVDFKIADVALSKEVLNLDTAARDANLAAILSEGANVIARLPIIPGFTSSDACIQANAARAVELGILRADILPFHQLGESKYASLGMPYEMKDVPQLGEQDVQRAVDICTNAGLKVVVRGE